MIRSIMVQGTCSSAGKSIITTVLCRTFLDAGYSVAPFKAQNMTGNVDRLEDDSYIARTQLIQAEACKMEYSYDINPILLIPNSDTRSTVVVNGRPFESSQASEYYRDKNRLKESVEKSYNRLAKDHNCLVIEGAGSPAEINLRYGDFVNMGLADMVDAPVILVGDIERGGVFASIYGTYNILDKRDSDRIKGFIVNKFRGDIDILKPGIVELERKIGIPCLGVLPFVDIDIEDEDSLVANEKKNIIRDPKDRDIEISRLAEEFGKHLDMETILDILERRI